MKNYSSKKVKRLAKHNTIAKLDKQLKALNILRHGYENNLDMPECPLCDVIIPVRNKCNACVWFIHGIRNITRLPCSQHSDILLFRQFSKLRDKSETENRLELIGIQVNAIQRAKKMLRKRKEKNAMSKRKSSMQAS